MFKVQFHLTMYKGNGLDDNTKVIIIKENNNFSTKTVHNTTLFTYTGPFVPLDEYDKISTDDIEILDTYNINI